MQRALTRTPAEARRAFSKMGFLMASSGRSGKPLHPTNLHVARALFPNDTIQSRLPNPAWLEQWLDTQIQFDSVWENKVVERIQRYGDPGNTESPLIPYAVGWMKFVRDTGYEHEYVEAPVWHKAFRFAGRFDTYGYLKRPSCYAMIDLKCGLPSWWAGVQVAAYLMAWRAMI